MRSYPDTEASVNISKADLVPKDTNLRETPRPRLPDQRRLRAAHPGTRRTRGEPVELTNLAGGGHSTRGRSHGHHRAVLVTARGQVSCPPLGRSWWQLTGDLTRHRSRPPDHDRVGVHRTPAHIRQVGAGVSLERLYTLVPHVHVSVSLGGPGSSGNDRADSSERRNTRGSERLRWRGRERPIEARG